MRGKEINSILGGNMRILDKAVVLSLLMALVIAAPMRGPARAGTMETFIILYGAQAVPADAASRITRAGGVFVYAYDAIGVAIARSDSASFKETLLADSRIAGVAATTGFGVRPEDGVNLAAAGPPPGPLSNSPANFYGDTLSGLQWDMVQIHVPEAQAITGGSPSVIVGDIDSGLDIDHPDLVDNIDFSRSVSCLGGVPDTAPSAWDDDNGHGTHTAGTIAAAANGFGIVGVAPNVKIAGIKAGNAAGFLFPEAIVCAFVWAATHQIDVTNNSYFVDPWLFNCRNDPEQRAIWNAERRAIRYALSRGVTVVAAEGNFSDDLAHPTQDITSPDTGPGEARTIHNDCAVIPVEIPGVIGVTATGNLGLKSFYSNYGVGVTQVAAPGGDSVLQRTAAAANGRVLSTYPAELPCTRKVVDADATYCYLQGTSMSSPHVAGVAALVVSRFGHLSPGRVAAFLGKTADPVPCPTPTELALYAPFPSVSNGAAQVCQGVAGSNSWYGKGQVNALSAVTAP